MQSKLVREYFVILLFTWCTRRERLPEGLMAEWVHLTCWLFFIFIYLFIFICLYLQAVTSSTTVWCAGPTLCLGTRLESTVGTTQAGVSVEQGQNVLELRLIGLWMNFINVEKMIRNFHSFTFHFILMDSLMIIVSLTTDSFVNINFQIWCRVELTTLTVYNLKITFEKKLNQV